MIYSIHLIYLSNLIYSMYLIYLIYLICLIYLIHLINFVLLIYSIFVLFDSFYLLKLFISFILFNWFIVSTCSLLGFVWKTDRQTDRPSDLVLDASTPKHKNLKCGKRKVETYWTKHLKIWRFGLATWILAYFAKYLRTQCTFFKTDFCIETMSSSRSFWVPWTL